MKLAGAVTEPYGPRSSPEGVFNDGRLHFCKRGRKLVVTSRNPIVGREAGEDAPKSSVVEDYLEHMDLPLR
jgi:hypothetical protein